jgi:tol-pal system protein YbgF
MRMLRLVLVMAFLPMASFAQDAQTLADIRAQIAQLQADFNSLKSELVNSGAAATGVAGGDALQRMDAIEAELVRLTAKTEEVELKLNRVVTDGTNRIGDLEFRLCEMEEGCDIAALPETALLGGVALGGGAVAPVQPTDPAAGGAATGTGPELAIGEQNDFDRAKEVLGSGDFRTAADLFATFTQSYPGGPLTQEAHYLRGEALSQSGDTAGAARSYLEAFSGQPSGPQAAPALLKLGQALGALGQTPEACVTLQEVGTRFPGSVEAATAATSMQGLGCS